MLIKVQFVGEAAVDEGGPKREFFCLLHKELYSSSLFAGGEQGEGKVFAHNLVAVQGNEYYFYGLCCGLAIVNGAVGPQFFCAPVVDYILYGDVKHVKHSIDSIPNKEIRLKLQHLNSTSDAKLFESKMLADFSKPIQVMGYTKPILFADKNELLSSATVHYTLSHSLCELNQFIDGLKVVGVLDILGKHPFESRTIFQSSSNVLTAELVNDIFSAVLSCEGSNRNEKEKTILFYWNQFLEDAEQGLLQSEVYDPSKDCNLTVNITLSAILAFVTGSTHVPPLGLHPQPSIAFIYEDGNRKMYVSTCTNTMYFPVTERFLQYGTFKKEFLFCMLNSPGFGNV